jgi:hypothetical protein
VVVREDPPQPDPGAIERLLTVQHRLVHAILPCRNTRIKPPRQSSARGRGDDGRTIDEAPSPRTGRQFVEELAVIQGTM